MREISQFYYPSVLWGLKEKAEKNWVKIGAKLAKKGPGGVALVTH
jgi:hypothetical protein